MELLILAGVVLLLVGMTTSSSSGPASGRLVLQRENARGVHPQLQGLLDAWEEQGSHAVLIPSEPWGGLRTSESEQAELAAGGYSGASTLSSTPHGRGAGIDVWPADFPEYVNGTWEAVPASIKAKFQAFGEFAEARGFTWGGRWRTRAGPNGTTLPWPNGDQPHVEIRNWRSLPFPPPAGGYS